MADHMVRAYPKLVNVNASDLLASFIKNNADAIWMIDNEDLVLEANPAFEKLFGWSAEEVIGKKLPIVPDRLQEDMDRIHLRIKAGETVAGLETIRKRKDGSFVHVEATLSPLRDPAGEIVGITGICRDVTKRKIAEAELKETTEQLRSFFVNNADAIWMIDAEDIVLGANPAFETLFGWSAEEAIGRKLPIVPDELKDAMERIHRHIKAGNTVVGLETMRRRKDGTLVHVEATLSPLRDPAGAIVGITGICRDVTTRKRAEENLRDKTEQLESFIENNADAIAIVDNDGIVVRVNEAFENIFGWSKEEIVGAEIRRLPFVPVEYEEEADRLLDQLNAGQPLHYVETVRKRKSGELLSVTVTASPILDWQGNMKGRSVTLRDVTERNIAQAHFRNSEKLAVAGQLAAGIAHEIRNPITSIKGFTQLMRSGVADKRQYLDIMASEIERIELILNELLILAKPQAIKFERKDIRAILNQVMTLLDSQANLNGVEFELAFDSRTPYLHCDENQLKQVFINFIKNAIESMPRGGKLTIETSGDDERMVVRLADQGCGIPKDVLAKLGQPFYTTKDKGTGLGFMVSRQIIEQHAGDIRIESEVDVGTTVYITLPVNH